MGSKTLLIRVPGTPPPPAAALPHVPGFDLLEEVGKGGMGVVYKARQHGLNRVVAVKTILGAHVDSLLRFLAEAEAVASVRHPNVVQVYEFDTTAADGAPGLPFMAMEYVGGGSLAARLAAGPLSPREAAELVEGVARGVQAVHEVGITHRDLKPSNILLSAAADAAPAAGADTRPGGRSATGGAPRVVPKVSDFGLAKRTGAPDLTLTGVALGTPAYMSPEQARGQSQFVGPATDVHALGAILFECLTGRPPYVADTLDTVMFLVMRADPPSVRGHAPGAPRDLDLICRKCLAKRPADRYQSAGELADDLRRFLGGEPVTVRAAGAAERAWGWARRNPAVAALSAGLAAVTLAAVVGLFALWQRAAGQADAAEQARAAERARAEEAEAARAAERERAAQLAAANRAAGRRAQELAAVAADLITVTYASDQRLVTTAGGKRLLLRALAACRQAADAPDTPRATRLRLSSAFLMAGSLFEQHGPAPDAIELYRAAAQVVRPLAAGPPDPEAAGQLSAALAHLAHALAERGRAAEALPLAEEAVALDRAGLAAAAEPDRPNWRGNLALRVEVLGAVLRALGRRAAAERAYREARELAPNPDILRLAAGGLALLAASAPADAPDERERYLAAAVEALRAAVDGGWQHPGPNYHPHTAGNADFRPFADRPAVAELLAKSARP